MAISTNGAIIARFVGGLYNTVLSNATYLELVSQDSSALANKLYAADFGKKTDLEVGTAIVANLGMSALTGLDAFVAAQLTAAGAANKGAKIVSMLNDFSAMTADTTYGTYATAFNTKVDAALASSQTTGKAEAKFEAAGVTAAVTSFTLTTSVEAIVGSAGDDTITAPATVATTGAAQTTINSGDSIDGGAGTDTLTLTITGANNNSLTGLTIKGVEKIVYVGSDNLASGAADLAAATAAKAVTAAAVVAANAATVAAKTATETAKAVDAAADVIAAITTYDAMFTATTASTGNAVSNNYSVAQYNAAASAALLSSTGTALTADSAVAARAVVLAANAQSAYDAALAVYTPVNGNTAASGTVVTAEAAAYLADAKAAATLAGATAAAGTASIAANAEATSISIDGKTTSVTGLVDTHNVTTSSSSAANTLKYASTATAANVTLKGSKGTITFADDSTSVPTATVVTANVTGTTKQTAATQTTNASGGSITLVDTLNGDTDTIKTLNVGLTSDTSLTISGLTKVTKIDGSASTGGLTLTSLLTTLNVTTGSGKDVVTFVPKTDSTSATKATSSLSTGAGNDTITVTVNADSTGTTTVDAGAGDDSVTLAVLGSATVEGGEGKDTINLDKTAFSTGAYNLMKSSLTNFEVLGLTGFIAADATANPPVVGTGPVVDAAKASQFTEFTFKQASNENGAITKVADTQIINSTKADVSVSAAGYTAKGVADTDGNTAATTTYAGALTINAKGGGQSGATGADDANTLDLTVNASSLTLNVTTVASSTTPAVTPSYVALTGDVKTAAITVTNGVDKMTVAGSDISSTVKLAPTNANGNNATGYTNLGNLTAVTLTGTGVAIVDNSGTSSKLASIDASGLAGTKTIAGATLGDATAGLTWTAGTLAETVKLGSALDNLTIGTSASTYAKMDSITGFKLVLDATGAFTNTTAGKSDDITVGTVTANAFAKATAGYSTTSLDAALATLANRTGAEKLVFQTGGNTYIFIDTTSAANGVQDDDTVVELVGLIDQDALVAALNTNYTA